MCFLLASSAAFDVGLSVQGGQRRCRPPPSPGRQGEGGSSQSGAPQHGGGGGALLFRSAGRRKLRRLAFPHFLLRPLLVGVQECSGRGGVGEGRRGGAASCLRFLTPRSQRETAEGGWWEGRWAEETLGGWQQQLMFPGYFLKV